jgi:glycosyltransferase involved in cell wall biosynthesis
MWVAYRAIEGGRYPGFASRIPSALELIDGDVIYASKLRPTSYGLGLLARIRRRRPLLLDIDDWELGFFYRSRPWRRIGRALNLGNPNGLPWTWLMERMAGRADAVTVASRFLEARFGGTLIPHVRDTESWDPARHQGGTVRRDLGAEGRPLVMFLGTPRAYKGLDDLVAAVARLGGDVLLAIVGVNPGSADAARWAAHPFVRLVGEIPFDEVPRFLVAADVVAVPQRATSDTVGQVPAKLFDAMALGRPSSRRGLVIPEILDGCGLVVSRNVPRSGRRSGGSGSPWLRRCRRARARCGRTTASRRRAGGSIRSSTAWRAPGDEDRHHRARAFLPRRG